LLFSAVLEFGNRSMKGKISNTRLGIWNFLLYLSLSSSMALSKAPQLRFNGVPLYATPELALEKWGGSDAGWYLRAGQSLAVNGVITEDLRFTKNLWPPGMPFLNSISIKIVGEQGPFIVILLLVHLVLWSLALSLVTVVLCRYINRIAASAILLVFIASDIFDDFLLGAAIVYTDSICAALLLISSCSALLITPNRRSWKFIPLTVLGLAGAAYFRGQYYFSVQLMLAISVVVSILALLVFVLQKTNLENQSRVLAALRNQCDWKIIAVGVACFLLCVPNLIARDRQFGDIPWDTNGRYHWSVTESFAMSTNWMYSSDIEGFVADGGHGTACKVDPAKCKEINSREESSENPFTVYDAEPYSASEFRKMVLDTLVRHPFEWAKIKGPFFFKFWYSEPSSNIFFGAQTFMGTWTFLGFGASVLTAIWWLVRVRGLRLGSSVFLSIVVATLLPPWISHYEARYLIFPKVIGFITFGLLVSRVASFAWTRLKIRARQLKL
jgi:hypothetical protein